MGIYKFKAPNGQIVKLEGDTPPNEQDLDEIFANLSTKQEQEQEQEQEQPSKLQQLISTTSNVLNPVKEIPTIIQNPKQEINKLGKTLIKTALYSGQVAGGAIAPEFAAAKLGTQGIAKLAPYIASGISTTPATEFAIQKLEGRDTSEALKQAGYAGAGDIGASTVLGGLSALRPTLASLLAGIPKKASEIAIKAERAGQSIFKNEPDYQKLAVSMQNKMKELKDETGRAVGEAKEAVKNLKIKNKTGELLSPKFDTSDVSGFVDDELSKTMAPELGSSLDMTDLKKIDEFKSYLSKLKNNEATTEQLLNLKEKVHNLVNSYPINENAPTAITNGQRILKETANTIKNKIDNIAEQYGNIKLKEANNKYHDLMSLQEQLSNVLGSKTQSVNEGRLYNVFNKAIQEKKPITEYQAELNKLSPKVSDEYMKALASEQYKNALPSGEFRRHALMGGEMMGIGEATLGHEPLIGISGTIGLLAAMSPKTHKYLARASDPIFSKTTKTLAKQFGMRINDLLNT
jgi:hypothetical protein